MLSGQLVFVDIDTQRDFLEPDGELYVTGSEAILSNLARLTDFARRHRIPVLATACAHTSDEEDPEPHRPHCLVGTRGQERIEATAWPRSRVLAPDEPFVGEEPPEHLTLEKRRYDVFSRPDADRIVALYARTQPTFVVYGVATDFCVKAAVEGLLARGCQVTVVVDAIRGINRVGEPALLTAFARQGALLTVTEVVCGE